MQQESYVRQGFDLDSLLIPPAPPAQGGIVRRPPRRVVRTASPLRYPGAKSRARDQILELIPEGICELLSPFFGGGSVELAAAGRRGISVHGYDLHLPLAVCWQGMLADPRQVADVVETFYPLSRAQFRELQLTIYDYVDRPVECAARYYVLNRAAYSGCALSGGMSSERHTRFTPSCIDRLAAFRAEGVKVEHLCFTESIPRHPNEFIYADPPYLTGGALYGDRGGLHRGFDHAALRDLLGSRHGWLLSYNDCPEVRRLYGGYRILTPRWSYSMTKDRGSKEVLILGPGV